MQTQIQIQVHMQMQVQVQTLQTLQESLKITQDTLQQKCHIFLYSNYVSTRLEFVSAFPV